MFRSLLRRVIALPVGWMLALSLVGGVGVTVIPTLTASTRSSQAQFGVEHAKAKPKKKKKKKAKKPAKPRPKPNVPVPCASIGTRTIVNIPKTAGGTTNQQYAHPLQVKCVVDAMPKGQTVWITIYSYELPFVVDSLIKAHRRGVNVRVTSWGSRASFPQTRRLIATLGRNPYARSYAIACIGSCLASGVQPPPNTLLTEKAKRDSARRLGIQHAKGIAVSMAYGRVRGRVVPIRHITFVGSANFSYGNTTASWNATQEVVGDARLYAGLARYISATRWDRAQAKFPVVRSIGGAYELHFYPGDPKDDPILRALELVKCKYGPKKRYRTHIRIAAYKWTLAMDRYRRELRDLRKDGCVIGVVLATHKRPNQVEQSVAPLRQAISPRLVKAGVAVYDSTRAINSPYINIGTHDKSLTIRGHIKGQTSPYLSVVGGRNWTEGGMSRNSEIMLVSRTKQTSDGLWVSWHRQMRLSYRVPCYSSSLITVAKVNKAAKKKLRKLKRQGRCEQTRGALQRVKPKR